MKLRQIAGFGPAIVLGVVVLLALWQLYVYDHARSARTSLARADRYCAGAAQQLGRHLGQYRTDAAGNGSRHGDGQRSWSADGDSARYLAVDAPRRLPAAGDFADHPADRACPVVPDLDGLRGLEPKVIFVILYCFFPIAVACADGLASDGAGDAGNLLRSMRASRWQILWLVRLPGAMPAFFSGLRIAA